MSKKSLIVVDDERLICWTLKKFFEQEGYSVLCFNSGEQLLADLENVHPCVVMLDLRLPGIDGLEVLEKIMEAYPKAQVIMMSAWGTEEIQRKAEELGAAGFLDKPLCLPEVKDLVIRLCDPASCVGE